MFPMQVRVLGSPPANLASVGMMYDVKDRTVRRSWLALFRVVIDSVPNRPVRPALGTDGLA